MQNRRQRLASTAWVAIIALISGFLFLAGCGDGDESSRQDKDDQRTSMSSIDFRLRGFEGGRVGGDFRCRAEGLGSKTPNVRIDKTDAEDILIVNGDRKRYYAYTGTRWLQLPYTDVTAYSGIPEWAAQVAREGLGTYERKYEGRWGVTLDIRAIDPSFPSELFTPPETAEIRRVQ